MDVYETQTFREISAPWLAIVWLMLVLFIVPTSHAQILDDWGEIDALPHLWYNRVDGLHAGGEVWIPLTMATELTADAGYKTALGQGSYGVRLENKWFDTMIGASYRRDVDTQYNSRYFTRSLNGIFTLLGGTDYYDYFRREGGTLYLQPMETNPTVSPRLTWRYENHRSVARQTSYDLFGTKQQPGNPAVNTGLLSSLEGRVLWEPFTSRQELFQIRRLEIAAEHGVDWLGSDYDYTRLSASVDARLNATTERRSPFLRTRLTGSTGFDDLPHQRFGMIESAPQPLSVFGGMRTGPTRPHRGQHVASAFWEINLLGAPFTAISLPFLASRWDVYVHGGHGIASVSDERRDQLAQELIVPRTSNGAVHELGVGIGRIFRVIKLDATWRLDASDFAFRFTFTDPF